MNFGERIKELREKNFLTQTAAAQILNVPYPTYQAWELGARHPAQYVQDAIINKLGGDLEATVFEQAVEFGKKLSGIATKEQLHELQLFSENGNREQFMNMFLKICIGNDILINIGSVQPIFKKEYKKSVMQGIILGALSE